MRALRDERRARLLMSALRVTRHYVEMRAFVMLLKVRGGYVKSVTRCVERAADDSARHYALIYGDAALSIIG